MSVRVKVNIVIGEWNKSIIFLLNSKKFKTVSDIIHNVVCRYDLNEEYGSFVMSIDGYTVEPSESVHIFRDNDVLDINMISEKTVNHVNKNKKRKKSINDEPCDKVIVVEKKKQKFTDNNIDYGPLDAYCNNDSHKSNKKCKDRTTNSNDISRRKDSCKRQKISEDAAAQLRTQAQLTILKPTVIRPPLPPTAPPLTLKDTPSTSVGNSVADVQSVWASMKRSADPDTSHTEHPVIRVAIPRNRMHTCSLPTVDTSIISSSSKVNSSSNSNSISRGNGNTTNAIKSNSMVNVSTSKKDNSNSSSSGSIASKQSSDTSKDKSKISAKRDSVHKNDSASKVNYNTLPVVTDITTLQIGDCIAFKYLKLCAKQHIPVTSEFVKAEILAVSTSSTPTAFIDVRIIKLDPLDDTYDVNEETRLQWKEVLDLRVVQRTALVVPAVAVVVAASSAETTTTGTIYSDGINGLPTYCIPSEHLSSNKQQPVVDVLATSTGDDENEEEEVNVVDEDEDFSLFALFADDIERRKASLEFCK